MFLQYGFRHVVSFVFWDFINRVADLVLIFKKKYKKNKKLISTANKLRRRFVSLSVFLVSRSRSTQWKKGERKREMSGVSTAAYIARRAAQKERVRILYRRALKDTLNWAVHRHLFYQDVRTHPTISRNFSHSIRFSFNFRLISFSGWCSAREVRDQQARGSYLISPLFRLDFDFRGFIWNWIDCLFVWLFGFTGRSWHNRQAHN